jgi:flavorubredoxin
VKESFKAVKITDSVYWVGAIDWTVRDFHGYLTSRGTTYNAYIVLADKVTLIDTVKAPFMNELMARVSSVVDPRDIQYVISNHSEMDHSGGLPEVIREVEPEKVFASAMGAKALARHFGLSQEIVPVGDGETLSLGNKTLTFLETRMLHWPDSMMSYLVEDKVLFSQDGLGMHLATSERFADEIPMEVLEQEGAKYFANILLPYSQLVLKLFDRVAELGIPIEVAAPDHGPIWRKDVGRIIEMYSRWAAQKPTRKAVIVYDTMWGSTDLMARAIGEGLKEGGATVRTMKLRSSHRSDVVTEVLDAGALFVGSPTLNNGMFPTVSDALTYIKGLKPAHLIGAAFGSYGWSGEAVNLIRGIMDEMKIERAGEDIRSQYVPGPEDLKKCHDLGAQVAAKLKEISGDE